MKLLLGGSPCTYWSIAQNKNRETEAEGLGWELFKNYLIAKEKYKPDYFLYENNKSMATAIRDQITRELGVEPILINSALVSAQNRQRYYWTNIPGVQQPEDKGILLRDILETGEAWREKAYTLTTRCVGAIPEDTLKRHRHTMVAEPVRIGTIESDAKNLEHDSQQYRVYSPDAKSVTLCGNGGGVGAKTGLYAVPADCEIVINENAMRIQRNDKKHSTVQGSHVNFEDGKSQTLLAAHIPQIFVDWTEHGLTATEKRNTKIKTYPIYQVIDGHITIKDKTYPIKLADGYYIIRKLTVRECMRLQTVPEHYAFPVSNTQAYKMLGNGWTVDVIAHILGYIPDITTSQVEVLSMYDGMSCGHIALDKLGAQVNRYYATEIDKYATQTTMHNYPKTIQLGDAFQVREEGWKI